MKEKIIKAGWVDLGPQKASHMMSFIKGKYRMNFYTTTGTITVQLITKQYDQGDIYRNVTNENIDDVLSGY